MFVFAYNNARLNRAQYSYFVLKTTVEMCLSQSQNIHFDCSRKDIMSHLPFKTIFLNSFSNKARGVAEITLVHTKKRLT